MRFCLGTGRRRMTTTTRRWPEVAQGFWDERGSDGGLTSKELRDSIFSVRVHVHVFYKQTPDSNFW